MTVPECQVRLLVESNASDARGLGRSLSSIRAPLRLRLTAAQTGPEPILHYWYKADRNDYRRLCDDEPWSSGLRYDPLPSKHCPHCWDLHSADRRFGQSAFSLTYIPKGIFTFSDGDELYLPTVLDCDNLMGARG